MPFLRDHDVSNSDGSEKNLSVFEVQLVHKFSWYISSVGTQVQLVHKFSWYTSSVGTQVQLVQITRTLEGKPITSQLCKILSISIDPLLSCFQGSGLTLYRLDTK